MEQNFSYHSLALGFRKWVKHETCSISKFKVPDYSMLSLNIKYRVYILIALRNQNIRPSTTNTYYNKQVEKVINKVIDRKISELRCRQPKLNGPMYLNEVGLYLEHDGIHFPKKNEGINVICCYSFKNKIINLLSWTILF